MSEVFENDIDQLDEKELLSFYNTIDLFAKNLDDISKEDL